LSLILKKIPLGILFLGAGLKAVTVNVQILGDGEVTGAGTYAVGSQVTLSASAKPGYEFKGWSGDLAGNENPLSLTVISDIKANAHFAPNSQDLIYVDGMPALAGSYVAKLNDQGRRLLKRRVNRVGSSIVKRRNKVLTDLVTIEWDSELNLKDNLNAQNLSAEALRKLSQEKSALKSRGIRKQMKEIMASGNYEYVEPNWILQAFAQPNDSAFSDGRLWGLRNYGQSGGTSGIDANVVPAWDLSTGSSEVIVAVIDSGVRYTHSDLAPNMWKNPGEIPNNGRDDDGNGYVDDVYGIKSESWGSGISGDPMDDNGHGTHVAGTIGAVANGGGPAVGVAWQVKLMALKFLTAGGSGVTDDAITCIDYAIANGARIINASYGGGPYSQASKDAIVRANQAGILFVAAAGNDEKNNDWSSSYPCGYDVENVLSVAAINRHGALAWFSNYGRTQVDIGAPGEEIFSTWVLHNNSYYYANGTSMASPHVAGAAAVLASTEPNLSPKELRNRLLETAAPLSSLNGKVVSGGMLDLNAALRVTPPEALKMQVTLYPERPGRGENLDIGVRVSAVQPITGASVQVSVSNQIYLNLSDDGRTPDQVANDGIYSGTLNTPNRSSLELVVTASHSNFLPASQTIEIETIDRPDNDSFAQAFAISQSESTTTGSNLNASLERYEPLFSDTVDSTVWYFWRPPSEGDATVDTHGSSIDTTLAVFTGTSLSNLSLIASNDDADSNEDQLTSEVAFYASSNQKYWIQIGGYEGESGDFVINHPAPTPPYVPPPPPEESTPPVVVTVPEDISKTEGESTLLEVTVEGTPPFEYQWILNGGVIQGAVNPTLSLQRLAVRDSGEYTIMVRNSVGFVVEPIANLTVRETKVAPPNDDIENAEILFGESGSDFALTRMASGQPGEPEHAGVPPPRHSVWWKWTAPRDGVLRVDTLGSSFDTLLAAYRFRENSSSSNRRSSTSDKSSNFLFTPPTENQPARLLWPEHGLQDGNRIRLTGLFNHPAEQSVFSISVLGPDEISLSGTTGLSKLRLSASGEAHKQSQAQSE